MEIIRRGQGIDKSYPLEFTCKWCRCIFVAERTEYKLPNMIEHEYDPSIVAKCKCPCCKNIVYAYV